MGTNFLLYDFGLKAIERIGGGGANSTTTDMLKSLIAGGFAGTASKLIVYPLDTCKKRIQAASFAGGTSGGATVVRYEVKKKQRSEKFGQNG